MFEIKRLTRSSSSTPRILIVTPDLYRGGVAQVVRRSVAEFSRLPVELILLIYEDRPVIGPIPENVRVVQLRVPLKIRNSKSEAEMRKRAIMRWVKLPFSLLRLIQCIHSLKPDVIISHSVFMNLMVLLAKGSIPVITVDHGVLTRDLAHKPAILRAVKVMSRLLYKRAACLVAISRQIQDYYMFELGASGSKIEYIPNFVQPEHIRELANQADLDVTEFFSRLSGKKTVISVGSINRQKGHLGLIRSFASIAISCPDLELVILGDGDLRGQCESLAEELGVRERVHFLGFRENPFPYIARSDIFVLPSVSEGFPLVLLEAMSCGKPVIASDCPSGPREILAPQSNPLSRCQSVEFSEYGILVPPPETEKPEPGSPLSFSEQSLANAVLALMRDDELMAEYATKSLERADDFSPTLWIEKWMGILGSQESVSNGLLSS